MLAARCPLMVAAVTLILGAIVPVAAQQPKSSFKIVPLLPHSYRVLAVAFSPDGGLILSGGADSIAKLWDVRTGRLIRNLAGHSHGVNAVAFSPDGRLLASAGGDNTLKLWDAHTGQLIRTVEAHARGVHAVSFSLDGSGLLSGGGDGSAKLWEPGTGRLIRTFAHARDITSLAFSPDGLRVVTGGCGDDDGVKLWETATGKLIRTLATSGCTSVAFSPDGRSVLAGGGTTPYGFALWDASTGELAQGFQNLHVAPISSLAFSPDGRRIASGSDDKTIKIWEVATGRIIATIWGYTGEVRSVAFSPDGTSLVGSSGDNAASGIAELKVWTSDDGKLLRDLGGRSAGITSVAFAPDSRRTISAGDDGKLRMWDIGSGRLVRTIDGHPKGARTLGFSPDGSQMLSMGNDNKIKFWDAGTGQLMRSIDGSFATLSPNGSQLLAGSRVPGESRLLETNTGRLIRSFEGDLPAAFSNDGRRVLLGTLRRGNEGQTVKILEVDTGRLVRTLGRYSVAAYSAAFSPDGNTVISGGFDAKRMMQAWDTRSGEPIASFGGNTQPVTDVKFSPDGLRVLSGGRDNLAKLWDTRSGRLVRTLEGHEGFVRSVAFSPDGKRVLTGSWDTTSKLWNAETGELLATLVGSGERDWTVVTPEGFFAASDNGKNLLSVIDGLNVYSIEQFYQSLYRPDLVREKLAGDLRGLVRDASARVDLRKILASGAPPTAVPRATQDAAIADEELVTVESEITDRGGGIGRIEWRVNGIAVGIEDDVNRPAVNTPLKITRQIAIEEGENEIEIVAYNRRNLVASSPGRIRVTGRAPAKRARSRLFVLAAGINVYSNDRFNLVHAVPDARAIAQALSKAGNGLYERVDVTLVENGDVTRDNLGASFAGIARKMQPGDVFVLFIAGHGKTLGGRYYFIPHDLQVDGGNVTGATLDAATLKYGIDQEQWQAWLAGIPARRSVLLFDTCESGTLTDEDRATRSAERGAANDRLANATGRSILAASSGDANALEGYRGHGLFSYNVLEALERADGDNNGTVEVAELSAYVRAQVVALSEQVFKERQEPQVHLAVNFAFVTPVTVFGQQASVAFASKPTHKVSAIADLVVVPSADARLVRKLDMGISVTLLGTEEDWALVGREGRPLGYVAMRDLAPIQ